MKIVLLVEGATETAVKDKLRGFLDQRCVQEGKPKVALKTQEMDSDLLNKERLGKRVRLILQDKEAQCVVALMDVYPRLQSAQEVRDFLRQAVGIEPRFHAHAAQFEVEAWLLPYWGDICKKLKVQRKPPGGKPENVNRLKPPSHHLKELYRLAKRDYHKPRDARVILANQDITVAAARCPELKSLLNTLLQCAGLNPLP